MHENRRGNSERSHSLTARQAATLAAFNQAWQGAKRPRLADFAPADGDIPLLIELIRVDLERRLAAGEKLRVESYLEQWPALADDGEATLELIGAEASLRSASDASVTLDEFVQRFPRHAATLTVELGRRAAPAGEGSQTHAERSLSETADFGPGPEATRTGLFPLEPDDPAEIPLPEIPGYEVLRRIARGGMGEVLEARHRVLGRTVAIKMPLPHLITGDGDRERFLREARAAAQLKHPRICAIHEIGQAGGCPYIIMDFVHGLTLKEWRERREPTARQAAELAAVLARAVAYAHEHGVIHRDLKPSNVLVENESAAPVLTDFGLAKQLDDKSSQLTHSGQVLGTPAYMAPEQAAGHVDQIGPLSDVYSLGAVLYELLCGRPPFRGNLGEVLRKVQTEEPLNPRSINQRVHRDLETICLKALAKDPAARYESALAFAEDLERFSGGEPILARRVGPLQRVAKQVRRRPAMTATLFGVVAALVLAAWLAIQAGGNLQITRLNQAFEAGLDQEDWNAEHLDRMETLIARLAPMSAAASDDARQRLYQRYADVHHAMLRKPVLEGKDAERIEQALGVLKDRAADLATGLRKAFEERKSGWDAVIDLKRGAGPERVFTAGGVVGDGDRFIRKGDAGSKPLERRVYASAASQGKVELEAVFDETWRQAAELGLVLNALPQPAEDSQSDSSSVAARETGYVFRLSAALQKGIDENSALTRNADTFLAASAEEGELSLEILRGNTRLARQFIKISKVAPGPLRLLAARHANRLSMQVNDLPPLVFEDVFPLSRNRPGVFGVLWPPEIGLLELHGRRQALPAAASLLERGDEAYGRGALAEALQAYREEAIASVGAAAAQEARYKEAVCLAALERPEARQLLEKLAAEPGDRWPVLAACEIWLRSMRDRRFDEADAIFTALSSRYSFEQLAALTPSELREEILTAYGQQATGFRLYSYDPKRIEHLRRAVEVEVLLGSSNYPSYGSRWHLLRSLHAAGQLQEALEYAESMVGENRPWFGDMTAANWVEEESWLLCVQGRAEEALKRIDRWVFDPQGNRRPASAALSLARARTLANLQRWDEAEQELNGILDLMTTNAQPPSSLSMMYLLRGLLCERRGDQAGAIAAWRMGFRPDDVASQAGSVFLANLIQGSFSGEMTDQQADKLSAHLFRSFAGDSAFSGVKEALRLPPSIIREMWRSPRGREAARKIAFREVALPDNLRLPAVLGASELARQTAFGGQWTDQQEELVWTVAAETFDLQNAGKLSAAQALNLAMTWKGLTNFLGWGGLAPTLDPVYRSKVAYLFAHRYLALGKREEATRFRQTVLTDSPPDSQAYRLASQEAEQFEAK